MADIKIHFGVNNENGEPIAIGKRFVDSLSSLSQTTSDPSSIQYGSLENSGNVVIYDRNGYIKNLIDDGVIQTEGTPLSIVVNGKTVQKHISTDNTYDKNTKQLSMSLSNRMKDWSVLKYKGFSYPKGTIEEAKRTAYDVLYDVMYTLYDSVWTDSSIFDEMLSEDVIWGEESYKTSIKEYLSSVIIEYPFIENDRTYRDVIDEFCNMLQLQVYIDDEDKVKFFSARPVIDDFNIKAIRVPLSNLYSDVEETVIPRNKYDNVQVEEKTVKDTEEINVSVAKHEFDLSSKTIEDYPYISSDEFYQNVKANNYSIYFRDSEGYSDSISRQYVMAKYYYMNLDVKVQKSQNLNTEQVVFVKPYLISDSSKSYSLNYQKIQGSCYGEYDSNSAKFTSITRNMFYDPEFNPDYKDILENGSLNGQFSTPEGLPLEDKDETSFLSLSEDNDFYYASLRVLVSLEKLYLLRYKENVIAPISGTFEKYVPKSLIISIYGNKRTINFGDVIINRGGVENYKNPFVSSSSGVLQTGTIFYNGEKVSDNIKNTILEDYKKGVPDARFTIACNNYYYKDGELALDWSKGDIIKAGHLISIDNDYDKDGGQRVWKVTGRNIRYDNAPMLHLNVVLVKPIKTSLSGGLYDKDTKELIYSWDELVKNGLISEEDGVVTQGNIISEYGTVSFSSDISKINAYSFENNIGITGLYIPKSVTYIGYNPFVGCSNLESIVVSLNNTYYDSRNGCNAIITKEQYPNLIAGCKNTVIPEGIYVIRDSAFRGCFGLKKINVPTSVEYIGGSAFRGSGLSYIQIPKNVLSLGPSVFRDCVNLTSFSWESTYNTIPNSTFYGCINLSGGIIIPETIQAISAWAFDSCSKITSIYVPKTVISISNSRPFNNCSANMIIYTDAEELTKPSGWADKWNYYNTSSALTVKWGYSKEQYEEEIKNL